MAAMVRWQALSDLYREKYSSPHLRLCRGLPMTGGFGLNITNNVAAQFYAEQKINEAYDTILRADKVTAEMIPALCDS